MRILFAHNRYLNRGGEDESREQEMAILRSHGQEVIEYVVDNREVKKRNLISTGLRSVWNAQQYQYVRNLIRDTQPDILKVDNHFPILSPSIFDAAKSMGVPTVLSVRNYRLVCPSANLFRAGEICTQCVGKRSAFPAIQHRCYRGSFLQSSSVVLSNAYAHLHGTWTNSIDQYIAVSEFVKKQLVLGGFSADKISVKPNFISDTGPGDGSGRYAIFVGRLTEEKGIRTVLAAWRKAGAALPLKIIGEGPLESVVQKAAGELASIEYLKWRPIDEVCEHLGRAMVLIFPSAWLEPFGRSIIEAYSKGTPVIAADTEPMRDMIENEQTGLFFKAGSSEELAERVLSLAAGPERLARMRTRARERYLRSYSAEQNYRRMMEIFGRALSAQKLGNHPPHSLVGQDA